MNTLFHIRNWSGILLLAMAACVMQLLLLSVAEAQTRQIPSTQTNLPGIDDLKRAPCDDRSIILKVETEDKKPLDRQAVARLVDQKEDLTLWETTSGDSQLTFCRVNVGNYNLDVSAVGYLPDHREVPITGAILHTQLEVILKKDPAAVDLRTDENAIPPKARRDAKHAVDALKSGNLNEAQKQLDRAYKVAPASAQVNFLYGYLFFQRKDLEKAEMYLQHAAASDSRRVQTLTLLGRVQLQRGEYTEARRVLEQAVAADTRDWMAHNLLADAYLRQKQYDKAREQAQLAIDEGKGVAGVAQLTLGQALVHMGREQEGLLVLKTFLQTNPNNATVPQVKVLIGQVQANIAHNAAIDKDQSASDLVLDASQPALPASAWGPPGVDDSKPAVAAGVACPYEHVMEMTSQRVKELVDNMAQFTAIEDLLHEELDPTGSPISHETRKFDYVATISQTHPGYLSVDEYRNTRYGVGELPDHIVTSGFVSLALIFHPDLRDDFEMTCEGLGQWHGQATWLVHFRQRADRPNPLENYKVGTQLFSVNQKGRAWINADSFQVVHIESDLVSPVQRLSVQHQIAEYGPVDFQKRNVQLWLPQSVELFFEMNRHRYYRKHSFDHYMLFSVNSEDKPGAIKGGQAPVNTQVP